MSKQISSIYILRLIAMSLVVLVHVTGAYASVLPFGEGAYQKYHFINRIIRIEAGIFIMITGLVFFYQYRAKQLTRDHWKNYYKKRSLYIVLPYVIWALIYELHKASLGFGDLSVNGVARRILLGESYYQLHFIFLIVQLYLVLPLFVWIARKSRFVSRYLWLIGVALHLLYIPLQASGIMAYPLFFQVIGTFLLGGWIGLHYEKEIMKIKHTSTYFYLGIGLAAGTAAALLYYAAYTAQVIQISGILYESINLTFLISGSYAAFRFAETAALKLSDQTMVSLKNTASYSFGFYLLHPFVLDYVSRWIAADSSYLFHLQIAARYVLTMGICFIIIYFAHRFLPFSSWLFGKLPVRNPEKKARKAS